MSLLGDENNPLGKKSDSRKSRNVDSQKSEKPKYKSTYSLNQDTVDELEMMQIKLKRLLGKHVDKSEVIEAALLTAFKDYERNNENADFIPVIEKLLRK